MASRSLQPQAAARWGELLRCQLGAHVTRSHYAARRSMILRPPPVPEKDALDVVNNPLSNHPGSAWNKYWSVQELLKTIVLDLERLDNQEIGEIHKAQDLLGRVMVVWAFDHPSTSYKQGMHELLAMLFLVMYRDRKKLRYAQQLPDMSGLAENEEVDEWAEPDSFRYIEHDTFTLFSALMGDKGSPGMIAFYEDNTGSTGNSGMGAVAAANRVYALLQAADPQIHQHLLAMGVEPQLFLLRWLRLLFGREFHQEDVLVIWDSLFTVVSRLDQPNCLTQLVESFAVAMVLFVRPALIEYTDMHQCLRRLMKFPPVEDVTVLVETACDLLFLAPEERMRVGFVSSRGEVLCHQTAPSPPATAAAAAAEAPSIQSSITSQPLAATAAAVKPQPPKTAAGGGKAVNASAAKDDALLLPHVTKMSAMGDSDSTTAAGGVPNAAEVEAMRELLINLTEFNDELTDEATTAGGPAPAVTVPLPIRKGEANPQGARSGKKSLISQMVSGAETLFGPLFDDDKQSASGGGGGGFRRPPPPSAGRIKGANSPLRNESIFNDDAVSSSDRLGPSGGGGEPPLHGVGAASVATLARVYEKEGTGTLSTNKPLVAQKGIIQSGSPLWEPCKRFEELHERGKAPKAKGLSIFHQTLSASPQPTHEEEMRSFQDEPQSPTPLTPPRPSTPCASDSSATAMPVALFDAVGVEVPPTAAVGTLRRGAASTPPASPSKATPGSPSKPRPSAAARPRPSSPLVNPRNTWTTTLDRTIEDLGGLLSRWGDREEATDSSAADRAVLQSTIQRLSALRTSVSAQIAIGASATALGDGSAYAASISTLGSTV